MNATGSWAEDLALADLESHGLRLLARNFRRRWGELDLVMRDTRCLVFVEVRYRASSRWGGGLASVDRAKQRRLVRAANGYLQLHPRLAHTPCRFDVYAITGNQETPECRWVKQAFAAS
ncbi:MAG: YraN family protein [Pseudomonadales bacterium]|jgi:putative endonuclease